MKHVEIHDVREHGEDVNVCQERFGYLDSASSEEGREERLSKRKTKSSVGFRVYFRNMLPSED